MRPITQYPVVVSSDLTRSRDFYETLGFRTVFSGPAWIHMALKDQPRVQLGLMAADLPGMDPLFAKPPGTVMLGVAVGDADATYAALKAAGIGIAMELEDAPWGQRRFGIVDPDGVTVDVAALAKVKTEFVDAIQPIMG